MTPTLLLKRVKGILLHPKTEWETIAAENTPHAKVFWTYAVPLVLITSVASFIGECQGDDPLWLNVVGSVVVFFVSLGLYYIVALITNALANTYGAAKDFNRAFSINVYSATPGYVLGILYVIPNWKIWLPFTLIGMIGSAYLFFIGLQPMMRAPREKRLAYFTVDFFASLGAFVILLVFLIVVIVGIAILVGVLKRIQLS